MTNLTSGSQTHTPWVTSQQDPFEKYDVDPEVGLSENRVQKQQNKFVKNQLQTEQKKTINEIIAN